tara:strand:- start:1267 stop:1617 length:351 start_codon:yes stop_codon:yes gene_type:complete
MEFKKLPEGLTIHYNKVKWYYTGPFGYYYADKNLITISTPEWFPEYLKRKTLEHEKLHAIGVRGCSKPWCLMFESKMWNEKWKDPWWEKLFPLVCLPFNLFRMCKKHRIQVSRLDD